MTEKLLPCPFCGGEAIVVKTESCGRYIGCWDCGGRTEEFKTEGNMELWLLGVRGKPNYAGSAHDKAIAAWNRRADAAPVVRGEWKMDTDPDDGDCRCSSCKVCIDALHKRNHGLLNALGFKLHTFYKYCPNCGAKMEDKPCG